MFFGVVLALFGCGYGKLANPASLE